MANKLNRFMYQDKASGIWYFQKKAPKVEKPYKLSLGTRSVVEARRKRDELLRQIDIYGFIQNDVPATEVKETVFGEVASKWAEIVKKDLEVTTFDGYRAVMNGHVLPVFGNRPISSITALDIETFISRLDCKKKTKVNILTPFRLVMKFAKM